MANNWGDTLRKKQGLYAWNPSDECEVVVQKKLNQVAIAEDERRRVKKIKRGKHWCSFTREDIRWAWECEPDFWLRHQLDMGFVRKKKEFPYRKLI